MDTPEGLTRYDCPECKKQYFRAFDTTSVSKPVYCRNCGTELVRKDATLSESASAGG